MYNFILNFENGHLTGPGKVSVNLLLTMDRIFYDTILLIR